MGTRFPGTWISRGNGQEHLTSIRSPVFTGSGSCAETLVSEDGLPVRPTGMCNVNQMFEINSEQASGIEVWRGAGTVVHGSNAMHGVLNVISPLIEENYASIGVGSNNYKNIRLGAKAQYKTGLWQVAANGASDGGYKEDSGYDQRNYYNLDSLSSFFGQGDPIINYAHNNTLRASAFPNSFGGSLNDDDKIDMTYSTSFQMNISDYNKENLSVVAFIIKIGDTILDHEILNAQKCSVDGFQDWD